MRDENLRALPIAMVISLLVSSCALAMIDPSPQNTLAERGTRANFTHTVFVEDMSTTWCVYCPAVSEHLQSIYDSGDYPFYFVSLIYDVNENAESRKNDYNVNDPPTVQFDGGYRTEEGPESEETLRQDIEDCGDRTVPSLTMDVEATYLGDAKLRVNVSITNNEASAYDGHLRIHITEIVSRYNDISNNPFPYALLDFAFDMDVDIAPGSTDEQSTIWDGSQHDDGHGNDFGDIDPENIMIIAAVYNSEGHEQSYENPMFTYTAYWVDQTAACVVEGSGGPGDNGGSGNGDSYEVSITNIAHSPHNPTTEDQITFSATITGDVDSVKVVICSKTTETCKPPAVMTLGTSEKYTVTVGPYEEDDYGYHIIVTDPGGSHHESEEHNFKVIGKDTSGKSGFIPGLSESQSNFMLFLIIIVVVVIILALVLKRRRGVEELASPKEQAITSTPPLAQKSVRKTPKKISSYENITCPSCSSVFAVPSGIRPIRVQCPKCGTKGRLE